jgi:hypothetical protein
MARCVCGPFLKGWAVLALRAPLSFFSVRLEPHGDPADYPGEPRALPASELPAVDEQFIIHEGILV